MVSCLSSCLGRLVGLVLLIVLAAFAWVHRDRILAVWQDIHGHAEAAGSAASPELARRTERRIRQLVGGHRVRRLALGQAEVQSLVRYDMSRLPLYLRYARIRISDGRLTVNARVPKAQMPRPKGSAAFLHLLPDTTDVRSHAEVLPLDSGRIALAVDDVTAARIPLPGRAIPVLLRSMGRHDEPGLPADAVPVRLPPGACSAYIHEDSLVLVASDPRTGCR